LWPQAIERRAKMGIERVAVIFDNTLRPDTTGTYCRRALGKLVDVEHFLPNELSRLRHEKFDLYLAIDDGLNYSIPADLHPLACWAIDTHMDFELRLGRAQRADFVFAAQRDGADRLRRQGISTAVWLPLACDPDIHGKQLVPKEHDVCFVGNVFPGPREDLLNLIGRKFPSTFIGRRFFTEMAHKYSASRIVFNRSLSNDINMRVFEALASGSMLITNDLTENGQRELFQDGVHLATYASERELLSKLAHYLDHSEERERIADAGRQAVLKQHTYLHRMQSVLAEVERPRPKAAVSTSFARRLRSGDLASIILVTHNQLDYTRLCLDSIRFRTADRYELIVVDNASTDGTLDYLRQQEDIRVIANSENRGFPAAANQGLLMARGDNLLLLNNDTVVTTGWLRRLLGALKSRPDVGLVGPCSNQVSGPQQIAVDYQELKRIDGFACEWGRQHAGQRISTDRLVGFCLLFRRDVVDRIGLLDERFGIGNFEDDDFCRRAILAGFRAEIAVDAFVHHFGHATFQGAGVDLGRLLTENQRIYEEKWRGEDRQNTTQAGEAPRDPRGILEIAGGSADGPSPQSQKPDSANGTRPRLSLCMIVRDNETTIRPCLESIRPWVDEIVIVDTGSKDRTPEICAEFAPSLHKYPWCDDFSAARNESLKHARGEWIFWMDSDDTISADCGRKLRELADGPHAENVLGYIMQVHCPGPGEEGRQDVTVVDHVKLIRNRPDLRFDGRIHEQLLPAIRQAGGDVAWTDLYVVHSGSDHSPETWQRKLDRDLRILKRELADRPNHPFVLFNLGMTYADAKRYDEAIDFLNRCIAVSTPDESHLRKAYALLVSSLSQAERHHEAWLKCQEGRLLYAKDKELLFRCAMLHHHFGRLAEAEQTYLEVLTGHEERHFTSVDRQLAGTKTRHNLAIVYEDMDLHDKSAEQWRTILADEPEYLPAWRGLAESLLNVRHYDQVSELINSMRQRSGLRATARTIESRLLVERGDLRQARRVLEAALDESPESVEPLQELCRLLFETATPGEAEQALRQLTRRVPGDASAWHNLGTACCQLNRYDDAADAYRKSLSLRPDADSTRRQLEFALLRSEKFARNSLAAVGA
jgi:GT2 family glycosyltransferase/tetratricopeptide (TPR) repeat protein